MKKHQVRASTITLVRSDRIAELWENNGTPVTTLEGHKDRVNRIVFSADGQTLATVSRDNTIELYER